MTRKKTLTIDDIASKLTSKTVSTETFIYDDMVFKLRGMNEAEYVYMSEEVGKQESDTRASYLALHLACAIGVVKIEVDGQEVEINRDSISVIGKSIEMIPLEMILDWDLELKKQLAEKVVELTSLSNTEKKKLELFRQGGQQSS